MEKLRFKSLKVFSLNLYLSVRVLITLTAIKFSAEINNKEIKLFTSSENLIAVKIIKTSTDNYKFSEKTFNDLNRSFSNSFFNDISNSYIQHLALKHKLQRNYEELEKFINIQQKNIIN